jgi:RimJ/RimL family protein N-acetyltransferase
MEPWGKGDFALLEMLNSPAMTEHLGGPESQEKLGERQDRYERLTDPEKGRMFKIVDAQTGEGVGSVGYWERSWRGEQVYEIGWGVLPAFRGRGVASLATAQAIDVATSQKKYRYLHAFPSVENVPSNAICRKLGFVLMGACRFEYPPGHFMQCNDWRLELGRAAE